MLKIVHNPKQIRGGNKQWTEELSNVVQFVRRRWKIIAWTWKYSYHPFYLRNGREVTIQKGFVVFCLFVCSFFHWLVVLFWFIFVFGFFYDGHVSLGFHFRLWRSWKALGWGIVSIRFWDLLGNSSFMWVQIWLGWNCFYFFHLVQMILVYCAWLECDGWG